MKAIFKKAGMLAVVTLGFGLGGCASLSPSGVGGNYGNDDRVVHIERDPVTGNIVNEVEATGDGVRSVRIRNNRTTRSNNTSNSNDPVAAGAAAGRAKACAKEEYKDTPLCQGN